MIFTVTAPPSGKAARLLGAAAALRESVGIRFEELEQQEFELLITGARTHLGDEAFARLWEEGRQLEPDAAIEYALTS